MIDPNDSISLAGFPRSVALLGPQPHLRPPTPGTAAEPELGERSALPEVLAALGVEGRVAVVTAGWQEREGEDEAIRGALGREVVNLRLHARAEQVFSEDRELAAHYKQRQASLRHLQAFYRIRLDYADDAARAVGVRHVERALLEQEWKISLEQFRQLDRQHLERCRKVHEEFETRWRPSERPAVARMRSTLAHELATCDAVLIAGGQVSTLLNRMRLFDLPGLASRLPLVAWSAGAMALADRVVLFHDHPPYGKDIAQVLDVGFGLAPGLVIMPDPKRRIRLDERDGIARFAQRMAPSSCLILDTEDYVLLGDPEAATGPIKRMHARRLTTTGRVSDDRGPIRVPSTPTGSVSLPPVAQKAEAPEPPRAIDAFIAAPRTLESLRAFLERSFPIVEGHSITFVWAGEAEAVNLRHWVYGLPSSQPLARVEGTPIWHVTIALPPNSRVEYKFEIIRGGHGEWREDPRNPNRARDPYGANSVAHGAGYTIPEWTRFDPASAPGRMDSFTIDSQAFGRREVGLYLPARFRPTRRYPLLIVHDGHDYLNYAALGAILDNLTARLEIPGMVVALTTSPYRLGEYANDERHARFLTDELVPRLEAAFPLGGTPQSRCLAGASFGAVASLSTAWRRPGFYGRLLLQSGSFAFTDIGDRNARGPLFDPVVAFMNAFRARPTAVSERVFVSCGTYESLIYENRSLVPLLQSTGMDVRYVEARDGHNWENWRDRLREGLSWLFPGPLLMVYE